MAQTNTYEISFENAVHHEALVKASFTGIVQDTLALRMSRTSPGRYALHEFAKNVYDFNDFAELILANDFTAKCLGRFQSHLITYFLFLLPYTFV